MAETTPDGVGRLRTTGISTRKGIIGKCRRRETTTTHEQQNCSVVVVVIVVVAVNETSRSTSTQTAAYGRSEAKAPGDAIGCENQTALPPAIDGKVEIGASVDDFQQWL